MNTESLARQHGKHVQEQNAEPLNLFKLSFSQGATHEVQTTRLRPLHV